MQSNDQMVRERITGQAIAASRGYRHKPLTDTLSRGGSPVQAPPMVIKHATHLLALRGSVDTADKVDYAHLEVRVQIAGVDLFSDGVTGGYATFSQLFGSAEQLFAWVVNPIKIPPNTVILVTYKLTAGATTAAVVPSVLFDALDQ